MTSQTVAVAGPDNPLQPEFWRQPGAAQREAFARLRRTDGPVLLEETARGRTFGLVRHRDVSAASRRPEVFRNAPGATTPPPARWVRTVFGPSMVNLDGPEHARLRGVVARAFTPRILARAEEDILRTAERIVERIPDCGPVDFVEAVAAPMPFEVLCRMMGIPDEERDRIRSLIDRASEHTGLDRTLARRLRSPGSGLRALARMHRIVARVGRLRQACPGDDLITRLVSPDRDGNHLTGRELGAFFSLLLVAGVETTRNALAHGLHLLSTHPEQRELVASDPDRFLDPAVEEIVRHSTPIHQFRRTVAREHAGGEGHALAPGDTVILFYGSANRDASVFPEPEAFDVTRSPNPHLGFGGGGPHYCLGAHLARQEIRAVLHALFTRYPEAHATEPPEVPPTSFDHRVSRLPFRTTVPRGTMPV
ncbi:cytochrome P450 [Streptomyces sp. TR02-1]|uniref:cytochrome P450 n=1 Tax=Streptomyces sp. TR02-1 TaxID=3385977 RepID=UPI0039A37057